MQEEIDLLKKIETTVQVLKEAGNKAETKSYMWVSVASCPGAKLVLYHYSQSRSSEVPLSLLDGFAGVLQSDSGCDKADAKFGLTHIGCLAHVRRKFYDAAKITKSGELANKLLNLIGKIYKVEKTLRERLVGGEISTEEFAHLRRV